MGHRMRIALCVILMYGLDTGLAHVVGVLSSNRIEDTDEGYAEDVQVHFRERRSVNDTSTNEGGSGKSAIDEFFSDPHNRAMYLILPLIILVYGGCTCIYCCYKCRKYVKKRIIIYKKEQHGKMLERLNSQDTEFTGSSSSSSTDGNGIYFIKSVPDLRELHDKEVHKRPATVLALYTKNSSNNDLKADDLEIHDIEQTQEEQVVTEELEILDEQTNPPEILPVVEIKTESPQLRVNSAVRDTKIVRIQSPRAESKSRLSDVTVTSGKTDGNNNGKKHQSLKTPDSSTRNPSNKTVLSIKDVAEIMQYYNNKKHMPNVIPEESENDKPVRRKARTKKIYIS